MNKTKVVNSPNRKQRRQARMKVQGKYMKITAFLKARAADLPEMTDKATMKPIDHAANLNGIYMIEGIAGVNKYIAAVRSVIRRDKGSNLFIRIGGWFAVKWFKLTR